MRHFRAPFYRGLAFLLPVLALLMALNLFGDRLRVLFRERELPAGYRVVAETELFRVYAMPESLGAAQALRVLEEFVKAFLAEFQAVIPLRVPETVHEIFLFSSFEDLSDFTRRKLGSEFRNNAGFYIPEWRALAIVGAVPSSAFRAGLYHEGTHMVLDSFVAGEDHQWSRWLNEGLASTMEESRHEAGRLVLGGLRPDRLRRLKRAIEEGTWIPLPVLLDAGQADFQSDRNDLYYGQSAALVYWLLEEADPDLRSGFLSLLRAEAAPGPGGAALFTRHLGPAEEVEEKLIRWLR